MKSINVASKGAVKIAIGFFIISILWIFFSDKLLYILFNDAVRITRFQMYKGWFYVTAASIILFYFVNREINKKNALIKLLNKKNEWQNLLLSNLPNIQVLLFDNNPGILMGQGKNIENAGTLENLSKKLDELTFKVGNKNQSFLELKKKVMGGNEFSFLTELQGKMIEIMGLPVFGDNHETLAGLLVFIDSTKHYEVLSQLKEEKQNYEALFKEYHAVNLELKNSYEKLKVKNIEFKNSMESYEAFLMQTTEAVYRIDIVNPIPVNISHEEQVEIILKEAYLAECNPVFASIYGYSHFKELQNIRLAEIKNQYVYRQYSRLAREFVQSNYILRNLETKEPDGNNNERYFLNNVIGLMSDDKLYRIWGLKTDITRLKQYEAELISARKQAEESDRLKSAFLANMSHEIRTPLNGIIGFSELLCLDELNDDQRKKYQQVIKTSTNQLLRIIEDILDISRIETGQLSVSYEKFQLNGLINELEVYLDQELIKRKKNIKTTAFKHFDNDNDLIISDKQRLYQVISNLLNNAIKFTEEGKIEFGYSCADNSYLDFFVGDTGIGIPESEQKSVFMQFKQVENYLSRKYGGTGLGLSISKGIVELLGGRITLKSEQGKGSVFRFTIPLRRV